MQKFWKISDSKSNKLIYIKDKTIYKGNPKQEDSNQLDFQSSDLTFLKSLFSIPYSYIKRIENQSEKNEIKIFFGNDSEEELIVKDKNVKQEIFEFLKSDLPNFNYIFKLPSVFNYGKSQFFAILFITGIFLWSLYLAIQIENGIEYEIIGSGRSLSAIILLLANLGVVKNCIGYVIILSVIIYTLVKKLKSRSTMEILERS
ncbi:hypothetical protein SAMN02927921_03869 [Sinomicrobium oceani]|uniref:Uncharacterized protein n=1 Tax=Sinomicrobium oceani TaxID=1150368 RepID=A0A1K1RR34_9FLAO|nr:hypothetical protein [Sinomicrobium oceani]SFW74199.1 hypothetical protein SAMN02927921_03869 [Sinomicrobium oceani]